MNQPQEGNSDEETFFDLDETFFNDEVFAAIDQQVEEYHATQQAQLHSQQTTAIAQQQTLSQMDERDHMIEGLRATVDQLRLQSDAAQRDLQHAQSELRFKTLEIENLESRLRKEAQRLKNQEKRAQDATYRSGTPARSEGTAGEHSMSLKKKKFGPEDFNQSAYTNIRKQVKPPSLRKPSPSPSIHALPAASARATTPQEPMSVDTLPPAEDHTYGRDANEQVKKIMARVYGLEYQKLHLNMYPTIDKSFSDSIPFLSHICENLIPDDIIEDHGRTQLRSLWNDMFDSTNSMVSSNEPDLVLDAILDHVSDIILAAKQHGALHSLSRSASILNSLCTYYDMPPEYLADEYRRRENCSTIYALLSAVTRLAFHKQRKDNYLAQRIRDSDITDYKTLYSTARSYRRIAPSELYSAVTPSTDTSLTRSTVLESLGVLAHVMQMELSAMESAQLVYQTDIPKLVRRHTPLSIIRESLHVLQLLVSRITSIKTLHDAGIHTFCVDEDKGLLLFENLRNTVFDEETEDIPENELYNMRTAAVRFLRHVVLKMDMEQVLHLRKVIGESLLLLIQSECTGALQIQKNISDVKNIQRVEELLLETLHFLLAGLEQHAQFWSNDLFDLFMDCMRDLYDFGKRHWLDSNHIAHAIFNRIHEKTRNSRQI